MGARAMCLGLLLAGLSAAGCGTVKNTVLTRPDQGGKIPFGGVRQDMANIQAASNGELGTAPHAHAKTDPETDTQVGRVAFWTVDLPFSFILDLALLPYTISYSYINQPIPLPPVAQTLPATYTPPTPPPAPGTPAAPGAMPVPAPLPQPNPILPPAGRPMPPPIPPTTAAPQPLPAIPALPAPPVLTPAASPPKM